MAAKRTRRGFGAIRKLPSGRYQASYVAPDLIRHKALVTFDAREDAEGWLVRRRNEIRADEWTPPARKKPLTFGEHAATWLENRPLKPRTRDHYQQLLDKKLLPTFGAVPLRALSADLVDQWHHKQGAGTPTATAHAYGLLRTITADAVQRQIITHNPVHIRGAGNAKRAKKIRPASLDELAQLTKAMPDRYQVMVLLAAWCGLRFGELAELRRGDIDLKNGRVRVRRGVVRVKGEVLIGSPKSDAGIRDVAIPPHLLPAVKAHLKDHTGAGRDALLFPAAAGGNLAPSTLYKVFYPARDAAGRPDLRFHDLRHTGAVLAASTGATLAELMARLGHSTPGAAMRYQHASQDRDTAIAAALSKLIGA